MVMYSWLAQSDFKGNVTKLQGRKSKGMQVIGKLVILFMPNIFKVSPLNLIVIYMTI